MDSIQNVIRKLSFGSPEVLEPPVESQNDLIAPDSDDKLEIRRLKEELREKSAEIGQLRDDRQLLSAELVRKDDQLGRRDSKLRDAELKLAESESLKSQYFQQWKEESAQLTSIEQKFECEKEENRRKDQQLAELQTELTDKSAENNIKSAEILKLRQTAQSLRVDLASKSDDFLWLKSQVQSALEVELNCSICPQMQMTEAVVAVECGHIFCMGCIDKWLKNCQTCPLCRRECHRSAPVLAIQQIQAKLLGCVNGERPTVTLPPSDENLPIADNNTRTCVIC